MRDAPQQIGPYRIEREIGRGGMGVVYLGVDPRLGRPVAIKALPASLAAGAEPIARFDREARILASLSHPGIAAVYGVEDAEGQRYLVLEYLAGENLASKIARGPLTIPETVDLGITVAEALAHAHAKGIVHRDVKPANVLFTTDGQAKLSDFGIARLRGGLSLTEPQSILGTPHYMSPEQSRGERTDARSDLFSVGIVLYEALTGVRPFEAERLEAIIHRIQSEDPESPSVRLPGVPVDLERTILRCLEKSPARRYPDASALASDLLQVRQALASSAPAAFRAPARPTRIQSASWRALVILTGAIAVTVAAVLLVRSFGWLHLGQAITRASTILVVPLEEHVQTGNAEPAGRAFSEAPAKNPPQLKTPRILTVPPGG